MARTLLRTEMRRNFQATVQMDPAAPRGSSALPRGGEVPRVSFAPRIPMPPRPAEDRELRCTAPHPEAPGRLCGAFLSEVVPGTVTIEQSAEPAPGCNVITCPRCKRKWRSCPITGQVAA